MNRARLSASGATRPGSQRKSARRSHKVRGAASSIDAPATIAQGAPARTRVAGLDALRGIAIVAMVVYHFCYDLRYFGITRSDFEHDPVWLTARAVILGAFMLIAGISLVLARRNVAANRQWLRHVAIIGGAAVLVTAASALMFPQSFIWFGVLHAITVSLVIARPLVDRPIVAALAGIAVIVTGVTLADPAFDNRALGWIGFMTQKPITEDYVPLFPWAGVMLAGIATGHWLASKRFAALAPLARGGAALRWLGRHSLVVYLLHQPLMIGLLWLSTRR
jgi:uncharacterized membrane protein